MTGISANVLDGRIAHRHRAVVLPLCNFPPLPPLVLGTRKKVSDSNESHYNSPCRLRTKRSLTFEEGVRGARWRKRRLEGESLSPILRQLQEIIIFRSIVSKFTYF